MAIVKLKSENVYDKFFEYSGYVLKGGYVVDDENCSAVQKIISLSQVILPGSPGVIVAGNPGCGKTLIFEILQKVIHPQSPEKFLKISCIQVVENFAGDGHHIFKKYTNDHILFDDLGTEGLGHHFKERLDVMERFIQMRYNLWRTRGIKTYFTTNLSPSQIGERYGLRCKSRLGEMCDYVSFGNKPDYTDRRLLRNFNQLPDVSHPILLSKAEIAFDEKIKKQMENAQNNILEKSTDQGLGTRMRKIIGTENFTEK